MSELEQDQYKTSCDSVVINGEVKSGEKNRKNLRLCSLGGKVLPDWVV